MTLRQFKLGKYTFTVNDTEATNTPEFDFWGWYSSGRWETTTIEEADKLLHRGDLLFDIGAWVGPLTLWEAARGVEVIAVEPDPVAFDLLTQHVIINGFKDLVTLVEKAVTDDSALTVVLNIKESGGNAYSSIIKREELQSRAIVETVTIYELIREYGKPTAIKMDIEGGESIVLPFSGPLLRKLKIPLLLATHAQWYLPGTEQAMADELAQWKIKDLRNQMWLCKP
jgi:FkbM family methyltransferase